MEEKVPDIFMRELGKAFFDYLNDETEDKNYVVVENSKKRFEELQTKCTFMSNGDDIIVTCVKAIPKTETGCVSVRFNKDVEFLAKNSTLQNFINTLKSCDAVTISGTGLDDGSFTVDFFVDDLFRKK